jgi:hypothetical protein
MQVAMNTLKIPFQIIVKPVAIVSEGTTKNKR